MKKTILIMTIVLFCQTTLAQPVVTETLKSYSANGKLRFDAKRGEALWTKKFPGKGGKQRQCSSCHGEDLTKTGKHIKSGKIIKPMAATTNPKRYTKMKKINKWFKRNCKWTFGRVCTDQEKGDFLEYLSQQ